MTIFNYEKYGGKKAFLLVKMHYSYYILGKYSNYSNINWKSIKKLIFICKGNICRSAYAHYIAKNIGIPNDSFGLQAGIGIKPPQNIINAAKRNGIDMHNHTSKNIRQYKPKQGDILIFFEPKHTKQLINLKINYTSSTLLGLWLPRAKPYIHDPYNQNIEYCIYCLNQINQAVNQMSKHIKLDN